MAYDPTLYVDATSPTTAVCTCPCGQQFEVDSIAEQNLVYDTDRRLLRAVCPRCSRLEEPMPFFYAARDSSKDAPRHRMSGFFDPPSLGA